MHAVKRWFAEDTNPERPRRRPGRRDRRDGPLHRPLRRARHAARGAGAHERRLDGLRDGQPEPRGRARGGRHVRARHRHRPLGLPEPDQQRPVLPGRLPRRARRARPLDHRGDEDGRRRRASPRSSPTPSCARTTSSRPSSTATSHRRWPPPSPTRPAPRARPPRSPRWATRRTTSARSYAAERRRTHGYTWVERRSACCSGGRRSACQRRAPASMTRQDAAVRHAAACGSSSPLGVSRQSQRQLAAAQLGRAPSLRAA